MHDPVSAPIESGLPTAWRMPKFLRVVAVVFVAGVVLFAGDADVTWAEFRWNLAFGCVAGVAVVLVLFRPRVRIEVDGMVAATNPFTTHRFACSEVISIDSSWLGHLSVHLTDGRRVALWAIQQTDSLPTGTLTATFEETVEFFRPRQAGAGPT